MSFPRALLCCALLLAVGVFGWVRPADAAPALRFSTPIAGDLVNGQKAPVVLRSRGAASRLSARVGNRDVTSRFRGSATRRRAALRGLGPGRAHLSARARVRGRLRRTFVSFVVRGERRRLLTAADDRSGLLRRVSGEGVWRLAFRAPVDATVRAQLNGRRVRLHGPDAKGVRRAVLSRTDGLRRGRNRFRVQAFYDDGRYDVLRRSFTVDRSAPMAATGRDARARPGTRLRLDAQRSRPGRADSRVRYRWRVVQAPRRARARIAAPSAARSAVRLRKPGHYVVALSMTERRRDGVVRRSTDLVEVDAPASTPAIGAAVDTMAPDPDGSGTGLLVDATMPARGKRAGTSAFYDGPAAGGAQVYGLDKTSLLPTLSFRGAIDPANPDSSLASALEQLKAGTIAVIVGQDGCCASSEILPATGPFSAIFAYDGQGTKNVKGAGTWNAGQQLGTWDDPGPAGGLTGYLRKDYSVTPNTFRFVTDGQLSYNTSVPDRPTLAPADGATYRILDTQTLAAVDLEGDATLPAVLGTNPASNDARQQWQMRSAYGGYYQLVNAQSGFCMNLSGRDQTTVLQYPCSETTSYPTNELWLPFELADDSGWGLRSVSSGLVVTSTSAGVLQARPETSTHAGQAFLLQPAPGMYTISDGAGNNLSEPDRNKNWGASLVVQPQSTAPQQRWKLLYNDPTSFALVNAGSGLCADVVGGVPGKQAGVDRYGCWATEVDQENQRWTASAGDDGQIQLQSALDGPALTLTDDGSAVGVTPQRVEGQNWVLERSADTDVQSTTFRVGARRIAAEIPLDTGGFALLAIDAAGRIINGGGNGQTFVTERSGVGDGAEQLRFAQSMSSYSKSPGTTMLLQSIGRPKIAGSSCTYPGNNLCWNDIAAVIGVLGGDSSAFLQLDGTGDFALAGCAACTETPQPMFDERDRRSVDPDILGARLSGTLSRDGQAGYRAAIGTAVTTDNTFGELANRSQVAWPFDDGKDGTQALADVETLLENKLSNFGQTCDVDIGPIRSAYCVTNTSTPPSWTDAANVIAGMKLPATAAYSQATLDTVVAQLTTEFTQLDAVGTMMTQYRTALDWAPATNGVAETIAKSINTDLARPANTNPAILGGIFSLMQDTLSLATEAGAFAAPAPAVGDDSAVKPEGIGGAVLGIASDITGLVGGNSDGSSGVSTEIETQAADYAADLDAEMAAAASNVLTAENVIVSDPTRLAIAAGNAGLGWKVDETASPSLATVLRRGAARSLWIRLLPTAYELWEYPLTPPDMRISDLYCNGNFLYGPDPQGGEATYFQSYAAVDASSKLQTGSTFKFVPGGQTQNMAANTLGDRDVSQVLMGDLLTAPNGTSPNAGLTLNELRFLVPFVPVEWAALKNTNLCWPLRNRTTQSRRQWGLNG